LIFGAGGGPEELFSRLENSLRIPGINLSQDFVVQPKPMQRPVIGEQIPVVEMFIFGFQDAESR
jgi:hypothetical protein